MHGVQPVIGRSFFPLNMRRAAIVAHCHPYGAVRIMQLESRLFRSMAGRAIWMVSYIYCVFKIALYVPADMLEVLLGHYYLLATTKRDMRPTSVLLREQGILAIPAWRAVDTLTVIHLTTNPSANQSEPALALHVSLDVINLFPASNDTD